MGDIFPMAVDSLLADSQNDTIGYFRIITPGSVSYDPFPFLNVLVFLSASVQRYYCSLISFFISNCLPMVFCAKKSISMGITSFGSFSVCVLR